MSWDALGKTLNSFVEERLVSPLLGTFLVSWCAWNYKFLVILFSKASITTTFALIESVAFPDVWSRLGRGFFFPLATTLIYLYLYPYPAGWVLRQWKKTQAFLTAIRREFDDEQVLTMAEGRELRMAKYAADDEIDKLRLEVEQMRRDLRDARRVTIPQSTADASPALTSTPPTPTPIPEISNRSGTEQAPDSKQQDDLDDEGIFLTLLGDQDNEVDEESFVELVKDQMRISSQHAYYLIIELEERGLIRRNRTADGIGTLYLTQDGRRFLFGGKRRLLRGD